MSKTADLSERVKDVLVQEWDPIGVRDVPQTSDEYDRYATAIVAMLHTKISVSDLSKHLIEIETGEMGLAANPARAMAVAKRLFELQGKRSASPSQN